MAALTAPGTPLTELKGVGPKTVEKLEAAGITSIEKLADMTPEQLVEIPGIGEKMVEKIHQAVAAHFEALELQPAETAGSEPVEESAEEIPDEETPPAPAADDDAGDESSAEFTPSFERNEAVGESSETPVARDESAAERLEEEENPANEPAEEQT
jgi:transcription termination/antitermination protein NusA